LTFLDLFGLLQTFLDSTCKRSKPQIKKATQTTKKKIATRQTRKMPHAVAEGLLLLE
jgi:hypothetical protein